jgi:hypothetical protein
LEGAAVGGDRLLVAGEGGFCLGQAGLQVPQAS